MGKDPRPGSLQADSIAPPPKRRALALKEMRMKVIQSKDSTSFLTVESGTDLWFGGILYIGSRQSKGRN